MSTAITLGPWEACGNLIRTKREADGSGGFLVAEVPANTGDTSAKAALMAASPDLLQALQAIVTECSFGHRPYSNDSFLPEHLLEQARAAISKATGEQS